MNLFRKSKHPGPSNTALGDTQEIDWSHRTIIHHVKFGYPTNFTHCADYPELDSHAYQEALQKATDIVRTLNLNIQSEVLLKRIIRLSTIKVMVERILETRAYHHLQALQLRSDLEYQLQNHIAHQQQLQALAGRIQQEIDVLERGEQIVSSADNKA